MDITKSWYLYESEDSETSTKAKLKLDHHTFEGLQEFEAEKRHIIHLAHLAQRKLKKKMVPKIRIQDFRIC